ncbi:MAG: zinc transporter ZntB [Proteobacteria bacterium]|nr:zinc transporter ZntB [Pseudomonadota bacterium]
MNESKITSFALDEQGGGIEVPSNDNKSGQLLWHHVKYTDKKAKNWIKKRTELSEQAKMILLNHETRPRALVNDKEVLICLRGINHNENAEPEDMISIRLWLGDGCIISSSNEGSQSINYIRQLLLQNAGPKSGEELLLALIDRLGYSTDQFVDGMDEKIDRAEDQIDSELTEFNPQMNDMRRQIAHIRRYLLPQREAIDQLYRIKSALLSAGFYEQIYMHLDKFIQLIENLDLMRERALMLQEHFMANISHEQNSRLYLLAIVSAIFLPLTFLSGLFGMNVGGMPGLQNPWAFAYVALFSVLLTGGLLIWFKKSRWF